MENLPGKHRAGRPRKTRDDEASHYRPQWPDVRSRRGLLNKHYMVRVIGVLGYGRRWRWPGLESRTATTGLKQTVLAELGRIADDALMKAAERALCKQRPATDRAAIVAARRARGGGQSRGPSIESLYSRLMTVINHYAEEYSFNDPARLHEAVEMCHQGVRAYGEVPERLPGRRARPKRMLSQIAKRERIL